MPAISFIRHIARNQSGATAIEYGLLITLIGLAVAGASGGMSVAYRAIWGNISTGISAGIGAAA